MTLTPVYLGIGSNIDRESNILGGLSELKKSYTGLKISPVYESKAFGFDGDNFFNLVVEFDTDLGVDDLEAHLREIEYKFGRKRDQTRYSSRTLDIDLLLYGDLVCDKHELPRIDIIKFGFVLKPLCDLAPDLVHPEKELPISQLWHDFNGIGKDLKQVQEFPSV
ncbi:MAG: 2-amino-4-hydroxy-6-hydroxymethyldihydropteridine diphosphokinase [Proteobacteria bacterium]|nr:2-amino-4-hydroxy-6-hydroxymethyldihydropteridine diphosphokinase [Pseudomonadota bacterium]